MKMLMHHINNRADHPGNTRARMQVAGLFSRETHKVSAQAEHHTQSATREYEDSATVPVVRRISKRIIHQVSVRANCVGLSVSTTHEYEDSAKVPVVRRISKRMSLLRLLSRLMLTRSSVSSIYSPVMSERRASMDELR